MANYQVYPVGDKLTHTTKGTKCLCHPRIQTQPNGDNIITHNSFDGREYKENKNLLVN